MHIPGDRLRPSLTVKETPEFAVLDAPKFPKSGRSR